MSSPAGLLYLCVDVFASAVAAAPGHCWELLIITGAPGQGWVLMRQCGEQENVKCGACHSFSACEHS